MVQRRVEESVYVMVIEWVKMLAQQLVEAREEA
jgi:hypothetical protein